MVVVVTGASRGIGLAVCSALLARGARVLGVARSSEPSLPAADLFTQHKGRFSYLALDLGQPHAAETVVSHAIKTFGSHEGNVSTEGVISAVVHNAGVIEPIASVADCDIHAVESLFLVNLFSVMALTRASLTQLRLTKGRIVFVSSGAATRAYAGWSAYCASKAALNMFAQSVALEEPEVVSVAVRPGVVDTEMQRSIREQGAAGMKQDDHRRFVALHESNQLLDPAAPAETIALLALFAENDISGRFVSWDDADLRSRLHELSRRS